MAEEDWKSLRERLVQYEQDHLLRFLPELSAEERRQLYADISEVNLGKLRRCFERAQAAMETGQEVKDELLEPLDESICGSTARDKGAVRMWEKRGEASSHKFQTNAVG